MLRKREIFNNTMIIFDQLRISDDGRRMYIDVHVNKADMFDNVYLDSIVIMTADQVSETAPEIPLKNSNGQYTDYIYYADFKDGLKEASLVLQPNDEGFSLNFRKVNFSSDLFFVYIKCKRNGVPSDCCIPCRLDEETTLGITFDEKLLHQKVMGYTKDLVQECSVPHAFIDFILRWNAFKSSVETEHWIQALKFYKLLFDDNGGSSKGIKRCGCHG